MEGDLVYTLSGHTSFVYSVSVLLNGDIISGGEDRTVRVWRGECHSGLAVQRLILEVHRWRMRTEDTYEGQTFFEYVLRCFWGGKAADHGVQHLGLFHRSGPNTVRPSIPISLSTYGSLTFAVVAL